MDKYRRSDHSHHSSSCIQRLAYSAPGLIRQIGVVRQSVVTWFLAFDPQPHIEGSIFQQFHGMPVTVGCIGPVCRTRHTNLSQARHVGNQARGVQVLHISLRHHGRHLGAIVPWSCPCIMITSQYGNAGTDSDNTDTEREKTRARRQATLTTRTI